MTEAMIKTQIEPDPVAAQLNNAPERHALLSVENLSAYYGKTQAVKDVTLGIMARAVTAIIGPSGCGKSTLLRCMNRMHEVTREARVGGQGSVGWRERVWALGQRHSSAASNRDGLSEAQPISDHVDLRERGGRP